MSYPVRTGLRQVRAATCLAASERIFSTPPRGILFRPARPVVNGVSLPAGRDEPGDAMPDAHGVVATDKSGCCDRDLLALCSPACSQGCVPVSRLAVPTAGRAAVARPLLRPSPGSRGRSVLPARGRLTLATQASRSDEVRSYAVPSGKYRNKPRLCQSRCR